MLNLKTFPSQLTSRKNALEIELNESLRRRRETLSNQLDSFGDLDNNESVRVDDLDAQTREAASLRRSIEDLKTSIEGERASL